MVNGMVTAFKDSEIEYCIEEGWVNITSISESGPVIEIPDSIEGLPVKNISSKAMLGKKGVREIVVPATVETIGDWAFSGCIHLKNVTIFNPDVKLGRKVFEGDTSLMRLGFGRDGEPDLSLLYGTLATRLQGSHLLNDDDRGTKSWLGRYDLALLNFIRQGDLEGVNDRVLCGEEDISYDGIGSVDGELPGEDASYVKAVSMNKCYLVLNRLIIDYFLSDSMRVDFDEYIRNHAFGSAHPGAWYAVREETNGDLKFTETYLNSVQPTGEEITGMLDDIGENLVSLKNFLIEYKNSRFGSEKVLSGLLL